MPVIRGPALLTVAQCYAAYRRRLLRVIPPASPESTGSKLAGMPCPYSNPGDELSVPLLPNGSGVGIDDD
jgi:hypothetical protein